MLVLALQEQLAANGTCCISHQLLLEAVLVE